MAINSLNHPKGSNTSLPPKRGKIMSLILEDFIRKGDHDHVDGPFFKAKTGKTKTTKDSIKDGILEEETLLKVKGMNESPKRKNSSLPPKRGMIKIRILEEILQQGKFFPVSECCAELGIIVWEY